MSKSRVTPFHCEGKECIDLAEQFGRQFRVEYEESYFTQYGPHARVDDPWLKIIPCRAGHICPWGGSMLAAVTNKAGPIARKLAALPSVTLWQDGSDGVTILFDVSDFAAVPKLMRPRRCRRLSPERRAKLLEAGAKYRFIHGVQACPEPRCCVPTGLDGLGATSEDPRISGAQESILYEGGTLLP